MWSTDFSLLGFLAAYFGLLGFITIVVAIFLKYLSVIDADEGAKAEAGRVPAIIAIETLPLINGQEMPRLYGATDQEDEPGSSSDLLMISMVGRFVICYDDCGNCLCSFWSLPNLLHTCSEDCGRNL